MTVIPNLRLLATEAGKLLKGITTNNEIKRVGAAIFGGTLDHHPFPDNSSERAQFVYSWLCTVGTRSMEASTRTREIRQFLHVLASHAPKHCADLDAMMTRAGFELETGKVQADPIADDSAERRARYEAELSKLLARFDGLFNSSDPNRRGYELQGLLTDLLQLQGIKPVEPFTRNESGEQIDGGFSLDGWHYVVECRWRAKPADCRAVDGLYGCVARSGHQTLGIFLAINGWSVNVPSLMKQYPDKRLVLMDGVDLRAVLNGDLPFAELVTGKFAKLAMKSEPHCPASELRRAS